MMTLCWETKLLRREREADGCHGDKAKRIMANVIDSKCPPLPSPAPSVPHWRHLCYLPPPAAHTLHLAPWTECSADAVPQQGGRALSAADMENRVRLVCRRGLRSPLWVRSPWGDATCPVKSSGIFLCALQAAQAVLCAEPGEQFFIRGTEEARKSGSEQAVGHHGFWASLSELSLSF